MITPNDHSNVLVNQNEHEKGTKFVEATGNGQNENNNIKGNDSLEPKMPLPIKVSSNLDIQRSNLQKKPKKLRAISKQTSYQ